MKSTWFISDTHFSHANIVRYSKRPFTDVETHDQVLIDNWNRHVGQGDDVYFLGDFAFKFRDRAKEVRRKLHARKSFSLRETTIQPPGKFAIRSLGSSPSRWSK